MNNLRKISLAVLLSIIGLGTGVAQSEEADDETAANALKQLQLARPDFEFGKIRKSAIEGMYEVKVIGGPTLYVSADASYIIAGEMYQIAQNRILPYENPEISRDRAQAMAQVERDQEIVFSPQGEVKAYISVFTDTTCGYCRKLHSEIAEINALGIEVRYLAYPREGLDSTGYHQMVTAWCAEDKQATLTKFKSGQAVPLAKCDNNPVQQQYQLGQELGVEGTPALVLSDGRLLPGYVPAQDLAKMLGLK